jgi:hypothetical protein
MSEFGQLVPDKIHLLRVEIVKGLIENPPGVNPKSITGYEFDMGYFNGFNLEEQLVKTELEISIASQNEDQGPKARGLFRLSFLFSIENFSELVHEEEDGLSISSSLGNAMASISYSTARGILLTRFQGTILKDFILPVIDPNVLLKPEYHLARKEEI